MKTRTGSYPIGFIRGGLGRDGPKGIAEVIAWTKEHDLEVLDGISPDEVLKGLSYEKWDCVGSLQDSITEPDGECIALAELLPASTQDPFDALEWKERAEGLARAIEELPEREKQIIVMYYYEELYISEMAEVLGVSESRVSQLHTRALYNLTRKLEGEQWQTR